MRVDIVFVRVDIVFVRVVVYSHLLPYKAST
jgi:hypothetical protein